MKKKALKKPKVVPSPYFDETLVVPQPQPVQSEQVTAATVQPTMRERLEAITIEEPIAPKPVEEVYF